MASWTMWSSLDQEVKDFVYGQNCMRDAEARFDGYFAEVKEK
jgi:hypothetical protein